MNRKKISIIIPVYNAEKYIRTCLDSILNQTYKNLEIICIDDGSTDQSLQILLENANRFDNIKVLHQKNSGPSSARNNGMKIATGDYIAFVDSDDYIEPKMYETLIDVAEKYDLEYVMCGCMNDFANSNSVPSKYDLPKNRVIDRKEIETYILPNLMQDSVFNGPCNKIYKKSLIQSLKNDMPEELKYGEDLVFQLEIFDKLFTTYFVDENFYHYVHREGSLTHTKSNLLESTLIPMYLIRKEYAIKWNISLVLLSNYFIYYVIMDLINTIRQQKSGYKKLVINYLKHSEVKEALSFAKITKNLFTKKIYYLFLLCKFLCRYI